MSIELSIKNVRSSGRSWWLLLLNVLFVLVMFVRQEQLGGAFKLDRTAFMLRDQAPVTLQGPAIVGGPAGTTAPGPSSASAVKTLLDTPESCSRWSTSLSEIAASIGGYTNQVYSKTPLLCEIERCEYPLVQKYVKPGDTVMEVGGRYGTTACEFAKAVGKTGVVISAEASRDVSPLLEGILQKHNCGATNGTYVIAGAVAAGEGWCMRPEIDTYGVQVAGSAGKQCSGSTSYTVKTMSPTEVELALYREITFLAVDCQGCGDEFHNLFKDQLTNGKIRGVYLEEDHLGYPQKNHDAFREALKAFGFREVYAKHCADDKHMHYVYLRDVDVPRRSLDASARLVSLPAPTAKRKAEWPKIILVKPGGGIGGDRAAARISAGGPAGTTAPGPSSASAVKTLLDTPESCSRWSTSLSEIAASIGGYTNQVYSKTPLLCEIERCEYPLVQKYVKPGDTVMEVGGRYGTTACEFAKAVGKTGVVISAEASRDVSPLLEGILQKHNCGATNGTYVIAGAVAAGEGWCMRPEIDTYGVQVAGSAGKQCSGSTSYTVKTMSPTEVELALYREITFLAVDCQGCGDEFHNLFKDQLTNGKIRGVYLEEDHLGYPQKNHDAFREALKAFGFREVYAKHCADDKHMHYVYLRDVDVPRRSLDASARLVSLPAPTAKRKAEWPKIILVKGL